MVSCGIADDEESKALRLFVRAFPKEAVSGCQFFFSSMGKHLEKFLCTGVVCFGFFLGGGD